MTAGAFDPEGGFGLALCRGLFVAATLGAFGTAAFRVLVAPRALDRADPDTVGRIGLRLRRWLLWQLAAALLLLPVWALLAGADMAGAGSIAGALAALPVVLGDTTFGHLALFQEGGLAVTLLLAAVAGCGVRVRGAAGMWAVAVLSGVATVGQAGHGHGWAMDGFGPLLLAGMVHLLAAGGWLGGLPPLLLLVMDAPPRIGAGGARWFSPLGKWCVAGMVASAGWQFLRLVGSVPALFDTAYGRVALVKLLLFGALFGFAVVNRYRLAPALLGGAPAPARRRLIRAIAVQTGCGLLAVLASGVLSGLPPAAPMAHMGMDRAQGRM